MLKMDNLKVVLL